MYLLSFKHDRAAKTFGLEFGDITEEDARRILELAMKGFKDLTTSPAPPKAQESPVTETRGIPVKVEPKPWSESSEAQEQEFRKNSHYLTEDELDHLPMNELRRLIRERAAAEKPQEAPKADEPKKRKPWSEEAREAARQRMKARIAAGDDPLKNHRAGHHVERVKQERGAIEVVEIPPNADPTDPEELTKAQPIRRGMSNPSDDDYMRKQRAALGKDKPRLTED